VTFANPIKMNPQHIIERTIDKIIKVAEKFPNGWPIILLKTIMGNIKIVPKKGATCSPANIPIKGAINPNIAPHKKFLLLYFMC